MELTTEQHQESEKVEEDMAQCLASLAFKADDFKVKPVGGHIVKWEATFKTKKRRRK
jgi:hypothetical protein